jgi:glycosyltransferase involved in cell wall biosynthesis
MASADVEFSVLVTCYYEENSIDEFYGRLSTTLEKIGRPYEIIFVNDGSRDGTWQKIKAIFSKDCHVHAALDFSKNSGQLAAITAALSESRGSAIVLFDSDLQLRPEELPLLVAEYDKGSDLVTGYRVQRKDSLFRIVPSLMANVIMRRASHSTIRDFGCTFKIYNAELVRAFHYGPRHLFSNIEVISKLDRISQVPVTHLPRKHGQSGWTFSKLMKYNTDNVVVLSERPFQIIAFLCFAMTAVFVFRLLLEAFFPIRILPLVSNGLLLNVVVISLLVNVALLSMVGEFTIRAFLVSRDLPLYIVRERLKRP